jgi:NADH pyrophosphatase NudC (nudix superfamily)
MNEPQARSVRTEPAPRPTTVPSPTAAETCRAAASASIPSTGYFCPVCAHEFAPEEIGKKPHCRRCGYLESCCNPDASTFR